MNPTPIKRPGEDTQRPKILAAALDEAMAVGFSHITRDNVAARAGVTSSLIHHYFGGMQAFRDAVMLHAIAVECLPVVAQGLALRYPATGMVTPELRDRALATV